MADLSGDSNDGHGGDGDERADKSYYHAHEAQRHDGGIATEHHVAARKRQREAEESPVVELIVGSEPHRRHHKEHAGERRGHGERCLHSHADAEAD